MKMIITRFALFAVLVLAPVAAQAYSVGLAQETTGGVIKWQTGNLSFYLHPDCSTDLNATACLNEVRASFAQWSNVSCTSINFTDKGFSNNKALTAVNGGTNDKNEVAWIENNAWFYGTYTLGVTAPWFSQDGVIFEADIAMNGYLQKWAMTGQNFTTDVKNVAVHEIGHFFGMQHVLGGFSQNDPPTMAPSADPYMASQTPNADDKEGVCFLYPKGAWNCSSNDDCPYVNADGPQGEYYAGVLACQGGKCGGVSNDLPEGDAAIGDNCVSDVDCKSPLFCQPMQGGYGVCASQCKTASPNCPSGFDCVPYQNSPGNGVCIKSQGGGGGNSKKKNGESCTSSVQCESFLCVNEPGGAVCRQPCTNANQCPAGEACMPLSGSNTGACFPDQGGGGGGNDGKAVGQPCNDSAECASGMCAGSEGDFKCRKPCGNSSQCPEGEACAPLQGGGGACFPDQGGGGGGNDIGGTGSACTGPDDCDNGQCASLDGVTGFCTAACASNADCPCGMACAAVQGGQQLCVPGDKVACVEDGDSCAADTECLNGLCAAGICSTACSIFAPNDCGAGRACQRTEAGQPAGICAPAGTVANDGLCDSDSQCVSLFCHAGVCSQACNPQSPAACASCTVAVGSVGVCGPDPGLEPDPGGTVDDSNGTDGDPLGVTGDGGEAGGGGSSAGRERASPTGCSTAPTPTSPWAISFVFLLFAVALRRRHGTHHPPL